MGCSASKTSEVVVPMPEKPKEDNKENAKVVEENSKNLSRKSSGKRKVIQVKESESDSLRGSKSSLSSKSSKSNTDRESSAKSTRTADSGVCESEDETPMITEHSKPDDFNEDRPPTPGNLFIAVVSDYPNVWPATVLARSTLRSHFACLFWSVVLIPF